MSVKTVDYIKGKPPYKLIDFALYYPKNGTTTTLDINESLFNSIWLTQSEIEELFIDEIMGSSMLNGLFLYNRMIPTSLLSSWLYKNYGKRNILKSYFNMIEKWEGLSIDYSCLRNQLIDDICNCISVNRYKWVNLYNSTQLEFNPLWNVDAHEETIRTLERDGTVVFAKTGKDTLTMKGKETDTINGTEILSYSGKESTEYKGVEDLEYMGSESNNRSGSTVNEKGRTTTDSSSYHNTEKDTETYNDILDEKYFEDRKDRKSFTNREDEKSFSNRQDTKSFNGRTNERTFTGRDNETSYNSTDTTTNDLLDTERIIYDRHGNIGVTESTKLLEDYRNFVTYKIVDIVAHDLANSITEGVY